MVEQMALDPATQPRKRGRPRVDSARLPTYLDRVVGPLPTVGLRPGSRRCQCCRCGLAFSSPSGFDRHQSLDGNGDVLCRNPASLGMVCRDGFWGMPGTWRGPGAGDA
jgi:hypothetical protein